MNEFIIWLVASFISTFGIAYMYYKINGLHFSFNVKITVLFFVGVILLSLIKYFEIRIFNFLIYFFFFPFLFYSVYFKNFKKLIYQVIVIWSFGILLDLVSMIAISLISDIFNVNIYTNIFTIIPSFLIFVMYLLLSNSKIVVSFINSFYEQICRIKYYDFILFLISIFVLISAIILAINIDNLSFGLLMSITVFSIVAVFITVIKMKFLDYEYLTFINLLKENNAIYIKIDEENRIFKHNLLANLLSIKSVSNSKARELIDELIQSLNFKVDFMMKMKEIPYGLNGVIYEKIYPYMDRLNIKINNCLSVDIFSIIKLKRYNVLVEKLVLLIDNAIESSLLSAERLIVININYEDENIIIEVKNTFRNSLDVDQLGKVNYSTKGLNRGFGLFSILRNNEVKVNVKIVNNLFVAKLIAKKNIS